LLGKEINYLSGALDNGYFDQTHFIKEFDLYARYTGPVSTKSEAMSIFTIPAFGVR